MGNPRFNIPDFEGLSALAKEGIPCRRQHPGSLWCTAATDRPRRHVVVESATKWIGGHGTSLGV